MAVRKLLKDSDGSYRITLPKAEVEDAEVVNGDGETFVKVDGDGRRFEVKILDL